MPRGGLAPEQSVVDISRAAILFSAKLRCRSAYQRMEAGLRLDTLGYVAGQDGPFRGAFGIFAGEAEQVPSITDRSPIGRRIFIKRLMMPEA